MKTFLRRLLLLLPLLTAACAVTPDPEPQYPIDVQAFLAKTVPGVYKVTTSGECEALLTFDAIDGKQLGYKEAATYREFRIQNWQKPYSVSIQTPVSPVIGGIYTLSITRRGNLSSIDSHNTAAELLGVNGSMYYFAGRGDNCAYILKSFKEDSL